MSKNSTRIDDPNHSMIDSDILREKLSIVQRDYNIRIAEGYNPHKRSAKRITILVSNAYLTSGGSIHFTQDLEFEVHRLCKEYRLDCDELEIESKSRFDNYTINKRNVSGEDIPLSRAVIHFFTYHYYKMEDGKNGTTYYPGKRVVSIAGNKQGEPLPIKERERITLCKPNSNRKSLSGRKIHAVDK